MKTKKFVIVVLALIMIFAFSSCGLPKGEFMETVVSPDGTYRINSYLDLGNATTGRAVRCEVEETSTGEKRNIYWQYPCDTADIKWIDNTTVLINEIELNVITDSYDYRDYL